MPIPKGRHKKERGRVPREATAWPGKSHEILRLEDSPLWADALASRSLSPPPERISQDSSEKEVVGESAC